MNLIHQPCGDAVRLDQRALGGPIGPGGTINGIGPEIGRYRCFLTGEKELFDRR